MGCFSEACSLSGTPIREGDDCYLVVISKELPPRYTLDLQPKFISAVIRGKYNDYGWIEDVVPGYEADYAKIEPLYESRELLNRLHFFVSAEAWTWAQGRYAEVTAFDMDEVHANEIEAKNPKLAATIREVHKRPAWFQEVNRIIHAHRCVWRNPLSGYNVSHQLWDHDDDFAAIRDLFKNVTEVRLINIEEQYKEDS